MCNAVEYARRATLIGLSAILPGCFVDPTTEMIVIIISLIFAASLDRLNSQLAGLHLRSVNGESTPLN